MPRKKKAKKRGSVRMASASKIPAVTGVVSEGTLRMEDLLPTFLSVLKSIAKTPAAQAKYKELDEWYQENDEENDGELLNDLDYAINEYLPDGWYFGATEGDGACFGIWPQSQDILAGQYGAHIAKKMRSRGHSNLFGEEG